jgi:hypothetical protein
MNYIEVTTIDTPVDNPYVTSHYPKPGIYQHSGSLWAVNSGVVYHVGIPSWGLIQTMSDPEPCLTGTPERGGISESTLLKVIAVMKDTSLVNPFNI